MFDSDWMGSIEFGHAVVRSVEHLHLIPNHYRQCAPLNYSIVDLSSYSFVYRVAWRWLNRLDLESIDFWLMAHFE